MGEAESDGIPPDVWTRVDAVEGWLSFPAADFTWAVLREQAQLGLDGPIVELGVFKAKYLSLLAAAAEAPLRTVVGFDGFFAGFNQPLAERWMPGARATMEGNVASVVTSPAHVRIVHRNTRDLSAASLLAEVGGRIGFASVDAGHEAQDVAHDVEVIAHALAAGGVIAADDVFNPVEPGVAEGLCRFLSAPGGLAVAAFATVGNKMFLTTADCHAHYLFFTKGFVATGAAGYLDAARRHQRFLAEIGYAPRFFGHEIVPFAT